MKILNGTLIKVEPSKRKLNVKLHWFWDKRNNHKNISWKVILCFYLVLHLFFLYFRSKCAKLKMKRERKTHFLVCNFTILLWGLAGTVKDFGLWNCYTFVKKHNSKTWRLMIISYTHTLREKCLNTEAFLVRIFLHT